MIIGPDADLIADIVGSAGDDVLVVKNGEASGNTGNDWIYVLNPGGKAEGGSDSDHIFGSSGDDSFTLDGNGGVDYIYGLGGNDKLLGRGGDFLYGGDGDDILLSSSNGGNTLYGGTGSNLFRIDETTDAENPRTTIYDFDLDEGNRIRFEKDSSVTECIVTLIYDDLAQVGCVPSDVLYAEFTDNTMTIWKKTDTDPE